ncbi:MAG: PfkB family carbohydrate kinase [Pseudomonadota bacterium]
MSLNHSTVIVVGSTTMDEIRIGNKCIHKLGGVTAYAGVTYKRCGLNVWVATNVAWSDRRIIEQLEKEGIFVCSNKTPQTTCFVNRIEGEERTQVVSSTARPIGASQISGIPDKADLIHLGPLHPRDVDPRVLTYLKENEFCTVLVIPGYVRKKIGNRIFPRVSDLIADALFISSIIKGDRDEIQLVLEFFGFNLNELVEKFDIDEVVVTSGADGGYVRNKSGEEVRFRAKQAIKPGDPTGAGDVFFSMYLFHRFFKGKNIGSSAEIASIAAAAQIEGKHISLETFRTQPSRFTL